MAPKSSKDAKWRMIYLDYLLGNFRQIGCWCWGWGWQNPFSTATKTILRARLFICYFLFLFVLSFAFFWLHNLNFNIQTQGLQTHTRREFQCALTAHTKQSKQKYIFVDEEKIYSKVPNTQAKLFRMVNACTRIFLKNSMKILWNECSWGSNCLFLFWVKKNMCNFKTTDTKTSKNEKNKKTNHKNNSLSTTKQLNWIEICDRL